MTTYDQQMERPQRHHENIGEARQGNRAVRQETYLEKLRRLSASGYDPRADITEIAQMPISATEKKLRIQLHHIDLWPRHCETASLTTPSVDVELAGSPKKRHAIEGILDPEHYGPYGEDGYKIGPNGKSLFVFDGISTYSGKSYCYGEAVVSALINEIFSEQSEEEIKFYLRGAIENAATEKEGGVVFSGFIRLSETRFLLIKVGDCPIFIQRNQNINEALPTKKGERTVNGISSRTAHNFNLQVQIVDLSEGDEIILASDGIRKAPDFSASEDPRAVVDRIIQLNTKSADEDDVIIARAKVKSMANAALEEDGRSVAA